MVVVQVVLSWPLLFMAESADCLEEAIAPHLYQFAIGQVRIPSKTFTISFVHLFTQQQVTKYTNKNEGRYSE